jgi:hypothetical protein
MFDELGYDTRVEHDIVEILHDANLTGRYIKICDFYMVGDSTIIGHSSLPSQDSRCITEILEFGLAHVSDMDLVTPVEQGFARWWN